MMSVIDGQNVEESERGKKKERLGQKGREGVGKVRGL